MFAFYFYDKLKESYQESKLPTKQELCQRESRLMAFSTLRGGRDFRLIDIPYSLNCQKHHIHAFIGDLPDQPIKKDVLVMLHGYGGTQVQYFKLYPKLLESFKVISIDLPGMGQSSKKGINLTNLEETMDFFLQSLEEMRKALGLEYFFLLGHSFGGYLAAQYGAKYPSRVKALILLSPAGTTTLSENDIESSRQVVSELPWYKQKLYALAEGIWNSRMTPQLLYSQWYGPILMNTYLKERFDLEADELELIHDYSDGVLKVPEGSERGLYHLFQLKHFPKLEAYISIEETFTSLQQDYPVYFLFGDRDWMDSRGANNLKEINENIFIYTVENAGHQINIENPNMTIKLILQIQSEVEKKYPETL